jgi:hypothetical protein
MTIATKLAAVAFAGILSSAAFAAETTNPSTNNTDTSNPSTQQIIADASSSMPASESNIDAAVKKEEVKSNAVKHHKKSKEIKELRTKERKDIKEIKEKEKQDIENVKEKEKENEISATTEVSK